MRLTAEGDGSAAELLDVARRLAAGRCLTARAWEGHLEVFGPGGRGPDGAAPYLSVVSDSDEAEYCEMIGEDPEDLGIEPGCFLVELRGRTWEAGSAVDVALEDWHCRDADEVCQLVADLLPRIADLPALPGPIGGARDAEPGAAPDPARDHGSGNS
ncbi:MAG: hypothetical protein SNJ82_07630 [Gemmataceae bacterium]